MNKKYISNVKNNVFQVKYIKYEIHNFYNFITE